MNTPNPSRVASLYEGDKFRFDKWNLHENLATLSNIVSRYYSRFDFYKEFPALLNLVNGNFRSLTDMKGAAVEAERDLTHVVRIFETEKDQTNGSVPPGYMRAVAEVKKDIQEALQEARLESKVANRTVKTAGEVRFIKDKSNDATGWAWNDSGPQERKIAPDFAFDPKNTKPLARVLRSTNAAMGHGMAAYAVFTKIKSADVSPDGSLGGKGYIAKISEMRRAYMNVVEALSSLSDTLYDEIRAPHWAAVSRQESPEDRQEVEQIVEDAVFIKKDPEGWAEDQEDSMDEEEAPKRSGK